MSGADDDDSHIIASVRRILGEDASRPRPGQAGGGAPSDDVFELSPHMMIEPAAPHGGPAPLPLVDAAEVEEAPAATSHEFRPAPDATVGAGTTGLRPAPVPAPPEDTAGAEAEGAAPRPFAETMPRGETWARGGSEDAPAHPPSRAAEPVFDDPVVEPRVAGAAGDAFGSLRDTLRARHGAAVTASAALATQSHAGGPTVEEMIREELRPLLKAWLDAHLPALVERAVRGEIARIVDRMGG